VVHPVVCCNKSKPKKNQSFGVKRLNEAQGTFILSRGPSSQIRTQFGYCCITNHNLLDFSVLRTSR
jgi:hypothetical protein